MGDGLGNGGGSNFVFCSAIILWNPIPTPSITASRIAHPMAPFAIARPPPRTASAAPVIPPAVIAFQGSSFFRMPLTVQSKVLNRPPHTPKLPPRTGARALTAVIAVWKTMRSVIVERHFEHGVFSETYSLASVHCRDCFESL